MKKLINDPADVVPQMLQGLAMADASLALVEGESIVVRADVEALKTAGKVAIVSGGGAGHEPAHAGYVGVGMLTAAVSGDVFTSPSVDAVLKAIMVVAGPAGVLLIVKNYTGDRLNFGLAAELARTRGIAVEMVIVDDDRAIDASADNAGRRGIAGTVLCHKVAGAAAEAGAALTDVAAEARAAIAALGTVGVGLSACTVPAAGKPGFELGADEMEFGLGIHGESGVRRGPMEPADALVDEMLDRLLGGGFAPGDRVALMVNNLGATPAMELAIVARRALARLAEAGLTVERTLSGAFLTALEMAGVSLTLLKLDDQRLIRLDAPAGASAWTAPRIPPGQITVLPAPAIEAAGRAAAGPSLDAAYASRLAAGVHAVCDALIAAESELTGMDAVVGDGDMGISLARGARAVRALDLKDIGPAAALQAIAGTLRRSLGGTSGPLYAVFVLRISAGLETRADLTAWADAFKAGCQGVMELGGAKAGDRTMLDAMLPAADALRVAAIDGASASEAVGRARDAAAAGAAATAAMSPRKGRSSYLGERALGYPDPGAHAVALWLGALAKSL